MKVRLDFVSNSSSSSTIIAYSKEEFYGTEPLNLNDFNSKLIYCCRHYIDKEKNKFNSSMCGYDFDCSADVIFDYGADKNYYIDSSNIEEFLNCVKESKEFTCNKCECIHICNLRTTIDDIVDKIKKSVIEEDKIVCKIELEDHGRTIIPDHDNNLKIDHHVIDMISHH